MGYRQVKVTLWPFALSRLRIICAWSKKSQNRNSGLSKIWKVLKFGFSHWLSTEVRVLGRSWKAECAYFFKSLKIFHLSSIPFASGDSWGRRKKCEVLNIRTLVQAHLFQNIEPRKSKLWKSDVNLAFSHKPGLFELTWVNILCKPISRLLNPILRIRNPTNARGNREGQTKTSNYVLANQIFCSFTSCEVSE